MFFLLVSAQWKRLPTGNEPPPARAYHSMVCIGTRHLLFGGFDGKSTFGDLWWLVPEGSNMSFQINIHLFLFFLPQVFMTNQRSIGK